MAENTETVQLGALKIKYSPSFPIGQPAQQKLGRSLALARACLQKSAKLLDPIATRQPGVPDAKVVAVLDYHFFQMGRPNDAQWTLDVCRIATHFLRVLQGLMGPVTVADAYATLVGREKRKLLNEVAKGAAWPTNAAFNDRVDRATAGVRGSVPLKKSFLVELAGDDAKADAIAAKQLRNRGGRLDRWEPAVAVQRDQYASIHINFQEMLMADGITELQTARTLIHEASHKFCNTLDHAYAEDIIYPYLTNGQAITNADSHAYTAASLAVGHLFKEDRDMRPH